MDFVAWTVIAAIGLAVGYILGQARARLASENDRATAVPRADFDQLMQDKTALATKLQGASEMLEQAKGERTGFHERALTAEAENKSLIQRLKDQQEQLRAEFQNMSNKNLEEASKKFSTQSEKQIGELLTPLKQRLTDFEQLVTKSFTDQGKEQFALKNEIQKIVLTADGLTKALRGEAKAQGNWGEVMLEKILEESGLQKGRDYTIQGMEMGLVDAEGNRQQPDVIVNLPDGKHIIIDSKVSLVAYDRYCSATDAGEQEECFRDFIKSVKAHVTGLSQKRYADNEKLSTPDFVLMFMPVEGAYSLAVQRDAQLHSYAWDKKIVLVCPSTLFATLRTIASLWRIEAQNRHAQDIALQGGKLYDKFVGFIDDMQDIDRKIGGLQKSYKDAMTKITGHGGMMSSMEKLKKMGAKASKSLPRELVGDEPMLLEVDAEEVASS